MKKRLGYRVVTAIFLCAILAIGVGLPIYGEFFNGAQIASEIPTASAAASDYGTLTNGSTYYFTDAAKIDGFRTGTLDSDVSFNRVNTSATRGSADNPFVISTAAQWNALAADTTNATDSTKVFVLGADIDFDGQTFTPISQFNATLYGQNYVLKNISYQGNGSLNCGLFSNGGATIAVVDISVDNMTITRGGPFNGLICGNTDGGYFLNCHTKGSITSSGVNVLCSSGGIVGKMGGASTATFYRCSSSHSEDITGVTNQIGEGGGGILGMSLGNSAKAVVYDCYARSYLRFGGTGDFWPGGIAGFSESNSGDIIIENCICYTSQTDAQLITGPNGPNSPIDARGACSSIFLGASEIQASSKITIKNVYGYGSVEQNGSYITMVPMMSYTPGNVSRIPIANLSFGNINWFYDKTEPTAFTNTADYIKSRFNASAYNKYDTSLLYKDQSGASAFWTKAKEDTAFSSDIWVNKSIISQEYIEDTGKDKYTIYNSPVRNPLIIRVQYLNLTDSGEDVIISGGDDNWFTVDNGETLQDPRTTGYAVKTNHEFLGWTADKTGNTTPITTATGLLGDVKLYAVWGIKDLAVTASADKATAVYGNNINLSSAATSTGLTTQPNWNISCKWHKKGDTTVLSSNRGYIVDTVSKSGTYLFDYVVYDPKEPLWRATGTSSEVSVTITPAPISVKELNIGSGEHAYVGMTFSQITPVPVMIDGSGKTVAGSAVWGTHSYDKIEDKDIDGDGNKDGKMKQKFTFTPTNENYGGAQEFEGTIDVEYLKISFVLPPTFGTTLTERLEYKQNYSQKNVADLFDSACVKASFTVPSGFIPYLKLGSTFYKIDVLRKSSTAAFSNVTDNISIDVEFREGTYTVKFDKNTDGDNNTSTVTTDVTETSGVSYGQRIINIKPTDPTNGFNGRVVNRTLEFRQRRYH